MIMGIFDLEFYFPPKADPPQAETFDICHWDFSRIMYDPHVLA